MGDLEAQPIEEKPIEEKPIEEKPIEEKPIEEKPIEGVPVELVQLTLSIDKNAWTTMPVEQKVEYAIALVEGAIAEKDSVKEQLNALLSEEETAYWALQREYEQKRRELEVKYAQLKNEVVK